MSGRRPLFITREAMGMMLQYMDSLARSRAGRAVVIVMFFIFLCIYFFGLKGHEIHDGAYLGGDIWEYQSLAVNISKGVYFRFGAVFPFEEYEFEETGDREYAENKEAFIEAGGRNIPHFYRTPAYPFLLGMFYKAFGVRPWLAVRLQILAIICIASILPLAGHRFRGSMGFWSGVFGGMLFADRMFQYSWALLTETMIAAALVLVLSSWYFFRKRPTGTGAALLGLCLAGGLLVKGSLIFLPLLVFAHLAVTFLARRKPGALHIFVVILFLSAPVAAYSSYATSKAGHFVLLSTQGETVLLDGNNELTVGSGSWEPNWREDPSTFFNRARAEGDRSGPAVLVLKFYLSHITDLPMLFIRKLDAGFGRAQLFPLFLASLVFYSLLIASSEHGPARGYFARAAGRWGVEVYCNCGLAWPGSALVLFLRAGLFLIPCIHCRRDPVFQEPLHQGFAC
jgi:hypothetical protein